MPKGGVVDAFWKRKEEHVWQYGQFTPFATICHLQPAICKTSQVIAGHQQTGSAARGGTVAAASHGSRGQGGLSSFDSQRVAQPAMCSDLPANKPCGRRCGRGGCITWKPGSGWASGGT
eukprot:scaffold243818_cov17-Tisochrysis_lutea.AAC.1